MWLSVGLLLLGFSTAAIKGLSQDLIGGYDLGLG